MLNSSSWFLNTPTFYNDVATQSVRLDDGSSAYLTFTPSSASSSTDRRKVTHSVWVKRGVLGTDQTIYSGNRSSGGDYYLFRFSSDNKLTLILDVDAGGYGYDTSAVFRDVGAWYHICAIIDTTQATDTDRVKIYVNGILQDKTTKYAGGHVPQNFSTYVMDGNEDEVGRFAWTDASYFDGYMSEFITTIGQDNTISEFGELKNGTWIPIKYSGSYGGNGFRFQFNQTGTGTASSSTIGADTSGNDNHWTSSGIVASDCDMPDSPENNFNVISPLMLIGQSNETTYFSDGNLKITSGNNGGGTGAGSTHGVTMSQQVYAEVKLYSGFLGRFGQNYGLAEPQREGTFKPTGAGNTGSGINAVIDSLGRVWKNGSIVTTVSAPTSGDIIGIAFDGVNSQVIWTKNGSAWYTLTGISSSTYVYLGTTSDQASQVWNFGGDSTFLGTETAGGNTDANGIGDFAYAPPANFLALCTTNLPEPTISPNADTQADDYFNTVLYTGNGSGGHAITGVGFQPDWTWIKGRSYAGYNYLVDSVRGYTERLFSNLTDGASVEANTVTSSDSDGFTVGSDPGVNNNTSTYVAWNWKASGGTIATNTDGNITSSVSANTDAGFSVVSYTGNSSALTIGHGLGKKPAMVIVKNRTDNPSDWIIGHKDLSSNGGGFVNNKFLKFDTSTTFTNSLVFGTEPTTTTIALTTGNAGNLSTSGKNYVAYVFAEIEGYSKFGSYEANNSTNGPMVYTSFKPAFVIIKPVDTAVDWFIYDNKRDVDNVVRENLYANSSIAEASGDSLDFLSNGFKVRNSGSGGINFSGTHIYMAFAENPFKYSTAR